MSDNGTEIRVLAASGVCGSGFRETSLEEGMRREPRFIGCDCGSTDLGPYPLGAGVTAFPRVAIKRDLRLMLLAARQAGVPLLLGSAGTAGGEPHIAMVKDILYEIAAQEGLSFPLAIIQAEQDKTYLKQRLREGRIKALKPAPQFDEVVIDRAERIVGMMGSEPYLRALAQGAQVVLAGRSSDTAIFADIPVRAGIPAGIAWHAAKIIECGAASVEQRTWPDCLMATLGELARLIRSKNAGPFELTFDIMFSETNVYERVKASGALTREAVAAQYGLPPEDVKFFACDNALAFKTSIPRPSFQGDIFDSDNHGGQQYAPLMDIEVPGL
jgi:hypothetical protein